MAISDDFTIDTTDLKIYHSSGTTVYNLNDLYSWIMTVFDDDAYIGYDEPIYAKTPYDYEMVNSWWIDYDSFKYLKGASMSTKGWEHCTEYPTGIRVITFASDPGCVSSDIGKTVIGANTGDSGKLLGYTSTSPYKMFVRAGDAGDVFDEAETVSVNSGTGTGSAAISTTGENLWSNVYNVTGSLASGTSLYVVQDNNEIQSWWPTGDIDIILLVKEVGDLIDDGKASVFARRLSYTYDHWDIDLSKGGSNIASLTTKEDINNQTIESTIEDWYDGTISTISIEASGAPYSKDLSNGNGSKIYDAVIDCGEVRLSKVYEVLKLWAKHNGPAVINTATGTPGEQYQAINSSYEHIKASPLGVLAGGKLIGARGIWFENYSSLDTQNIQMLASDNSVQDPPNVVTVQVQVKDISTSNNIEGARILLAVAAGGDLPYKESVSITRSSNTATVSHTSHGLESNQKVLISGAAEQAYNGVHQITVTSVDEYTYAVSGTPATPATGTITATSVILDGLSSSSGLINDTAFSYSSDQPVVGRARKQTTAPYYKTAKISGTITSAGFITTSFLISD